MNRNMIRPLTLAIARLRRRTASALTYQHVVWAYRLFLDREPENEAVILGHLRAWRTTKELRTAFLTSSEFSQTNPDLAYTNERTVVIKEIDGQLRLFIDLSDQVIGLGILRGTYERSELDFVRRTVKPGQTALDIGAHCGLFTVTMAALVGPTGKVYAFEPLERNAELLERSVIENRFDDRVIVERAAISDRVGQGQLVSLPNALNSGGSYLLERKADVPPGHVVETVRLIALDTYPLRRPVNFIKIDIEGAEPLALRGAQALLQTDRPIILSELNPIQLKQVSGCSAAEFVSQVESYGYDGHILEGHRLVRRPITDDRDEIRSVVFLPTAG